MFQPIAKTWCGRNTNKPLIVTVPYTVAGASKPYNIIAELTTPIMNSCVPNKNLVTVKLTNVGLPPAPFTPSNITQASDFITVNLPSTLSYVAGSVISVSNFVAGNPTTPVSPSVLEWPMTGGVGQNGVIEFTFEVEGNTTSICETDATISLETAAAATVGSAPGCPADY